MQKGRGSRRLGKQYQTKEDTDWAGMGPGRSAQAGRPSLFRGLVGPPFDLDASRAIYSPLLTVKIRQPSHEFTFGVGISFIPYPLVLTPVV
jgi:hypothetical protein